MRYRLLFIVVLLPALTACSNLVFVPDKRIYGTPDRLGLTYQDIFFDSADGTRLHGWFLPAKDNAKGTVLHLHGNAENISTHIFSVAWLPDEGFNVLLFDYRGYGRSEGEPSLQGVHQDFDAALHWLLDKQGAGPVIVFGQSIGGAIAIYGVAHSDARESIDALVVESAPSSYREIAREKLAGFFLTWPFQWPLSLTISDEYSPIHAIKDIEDLPLLLIHGNRDKIVPIHHGRRLYQAANPPKDFWLVDDGGHIQAFAREQYRRRFIDYLTEHIAGEKQ